MTNHKQRIKPQHLDYVRDSRYGSILEASGRSRLLLWLIALFFVAAIIWAAYAPIEQVTRGQGKVIPSSQRQIVQNLEGGIVEAILVREGEQVTVGQPLIQLDDTRFKADFDEKNQDLLGIKADSIRLNALLNSITTSPPDKSPSKLWRQSVSISPANLEFPAHFLQQNAGLVKRQQNEYRDQLASLDNQLTLMAQQIQQKLRELEEARARLKNQKHSYYLTSEEYRITKPLADEGVVPKIELLKLQRQVNETRRDMTSTELQIPAMTAALNESIFKRLDIALNFRSDIQSELNQTSDKLDALSQSHLGLQDKVVRTLVTSPVNGTVQKIHINTLGGVIQPGMDLIEVIPTEDSLLVEAQISPKDIGFLRPGLTAMVKFTAFDFTQYGGLTGTLEHISADTQLDEEGHSYYQIRIRTDETEFTDPAGNQLPIIPGMNAVADIITGEQTVLQYLLNPVLKAQQTALRE
ncbi:HlyD family type I secretion periplasmic adaptor subunit [Photobacterium lutimaris]|uniref:Membrane fusion protein (MFP) family protein n=1 Tax=Photobacterium lutimaris TaxID=388278 RepID=A0A2T3J2Y1_9GAMM|nr:HlyD family type I secretion periplasmic adaptor subunit [Photobacterium lutimaris]PSU35613.1 HlyD family type I secretion periplasmic adaptor subunit [Photobacterium lutimaris]TDR78665.1 adhesin transport system membrane fusion protein [Photobacterium lutimaris]